MYIYICIHLNKHTGRTAKRHVCHKKRKICVIRHRNFVQNQRRNNIYACLTPQRILEILWSIPIHCIFWRFLIKISFPLDYFCIPFGLCSTKMRAIEPELLKSRGGHRPQPSMLTFLVWPNGPHWCESTCARVPQTT